jgi:tetratricopeptide (TPR) repeat protein
MPDNSQILLNLGMALGDCGKLDEALALLGKKTALEPDDAEGWTALGVALAKTGEGDNAIKAFGCCVELDAHNGYGHMNLGSMLMDRDPEEGLIHLEKAAELLPRDANAQLNYGMALMNAGRASEADAAFRRTISMAPLSEQAEKARAFSTQLAQNTLRGTGKEGLRPDAAMYCLSALRLFAGSPDKLQPVTYEITMLGRQGLDMNDPTPKYTLKTLPGKFSGLHLVSYLYVGMKKLAPDADPGIDLAREYAQALELMKS